MGTVYAIANQKGGVGKTTTAVNLAACIAEAGYESLLVDMDPQSNATLGLGIDKHTTPTVYDALLGEVPLAEAVVASAIPHLRVVPAGPDLAGATVELPRMAGSEARLRETLLPIRDRYAFILLDCPPSLGPLTVNALVAADRVIVPVQSEYFALEGLAGLLDTLSLVQRELNPRLTVAGMLLTMHDGRTRLAQDVEAEIREHFPQLVFETVIPRNVRVGEAPSFGKPVIHYDPHCAGLGRLLRAGQGGGRPWLSASGAWAAGWRRSSRWPHGRSPRSCARSRSSSSRPTPTNRATTSTRRPSWPWRSRSRSGACCSRCSSGRCRAGRMS